MMGHGITEVLNLVMVSIDTKEVLDAEVISKTCKTCQWSPYLKDIAEFEQWQEKHISEGKCFKNFDGPSTGMETAATKAIWSQSISKYRVWQNDLTHL